MENEDLGIDLGETKQRSARTGRRAKSSSKKQPSFLESSSGAVDDAAEEEAMPSGEKNPVAPPRAAKKMSGWGEDSVRRQRGDDMDDERLKPQMVDTELEREDSDADIPVIPELEDQQPTDDLTSDVAMAPTVAVNRVATYRELDHDLLRHAAFLTLDNEIDLKPLAKGLSAEYEVQEPDTPWDWDRLFTEVTSELLTEWENRGDSTEDK